MGGRRGGEQPRVAPIGGLMEAGAVGVVGVNRRASRGCVDIGIWWFGVELGYLR
jgi:hypothetical protein